MKGAARLAISAAVLLLADHASAEGIPEPFGLSHKTRPSDLKAATATADGAHQTTVPKPHPVFSVYTIRFGKDSDLCQITGYAPAGSFHARSASAAAAEVAGQISELLGRPLYAGPTADRQEAEAIIWGGKPAPLSTVSLHRYWPNGGALMLRFAFDRAACRSESAPNPFKK